MVDGTCGYGAFSYFMITRECDRLGAGKECEEENALGRVVRWERARCSIR